MIRSDCGACGGNDLRVFLDLGKTPLANTFPAGRDDPETFYPLQLARCGNCGLVQQTELVPDALIYGDDYGFYSGGSPAQRDYHQAGAGLLMAAFPGQCRSGVLEIACNDGSMLRHFVHAGHPAVGVDPAAPALAAIQDGLPVRREAFTADLGRALRDEHGPFGLVIAYNSLAHVEDLSDVLTGVWAVMGPESVAVVEVQYLPDLIAGNLIGQVYHEHRYFHSLSTFSRLARLHGLTVIGADLIELQGGGIRMYLSANPAATVGRTVAPILHAERWLNRDAAYDGMQGRVDRNRDHLLGLVAAERAAGRVVAGYAAAAKATTILNYYGLHDLPYVADTTAYKHGRYVPGVKVPITAPPGNDSGTRLLLTANYLPHLLRNDPQFLARGGRWLIAEPAPMVI